MSRRTPLRLAIAGTLLAAALLLLAVGSPQRKAPRPRRRSLVTLPAPPAIAPLARAATRPTRKSGPAATAARPAVAQVALEFLAAWLRCTYHQARCSHLPGALPAYAIALARGQGRSLQAPAELAAHPEIVSLRLARSCTFAAVATAGYTDGEGGRFEVHLNLAREPAGWQVFDVAEAPPHVPLPEPLSRGPRAC